MTEPAKVMENEPPNLAPPRQATNWVGRARQWSVVGAALLVVGILVYEIYTMTQQAGAIALTDAPTLPPEIPVSGQVMGNPEARIQLVEWGDYACPECGMFTREVQQLLIEEYVTPGFVQYQFRDFASLGPESTLAAEAAFCAEQQGQFWGFHNLLFFNQDAERPGSFTPERLKAMAAKMGLNASGYDACVASDAPTTAVAASLAEGTALGVTAAPYFLVDGAPVPWTTWNDLQQVLDDKQNVAA